MCTIPYIEMESEGQQETIGDDQKVSEGKCPAKLNSLTIPLQVKCSIS